MIISRKNVTCFLNFALIPLIQQLSADLVDRIEMVHQSEEAVCFRCHLKAAVLPLFFHLRITRVGDVFEATNVVDDYPAVQLLVKTARCSVVFLDENTAQLDGELSLEGVPSSIERMVRKLCVAVATRLKVFIESS